MCEDLRNTIHDCYYDVIGVVPTEEQIMGIYNQLPDYVIDLAEQWGGYDTEVRDSIFVFIKNLKAR
ncbi:hypothetical protein CN981_08660 [Priestia megaterium]|nr:hypothetical protein CN981_08660 [Priestia megaterium]